MVIYSYMTVVDIDLLNSTVMYADALYNTIF